MNLIIIHFTKIKNFLNFNHFKEHQILHLNFFFVVLISPYILVSAILLIQLYFNKSFLLQHIYKLIYDMLL